MSGPVYVLGGNPVQPGDSTYYAYVGGSSNWPLGSTLDLSWAFSFTSTGNPVRTSMTFQTADSPGQVQLPNATEASPGQAFIMWDLGSTNIAVTKNDSTPLFTMSANLAYWVVLVDNTTQGGEWLVLQYGAGTSGGTAAALAGYGLIDLPNPPLPDTLNVDFTKVSQNSNFTLNVINWGQLLLCEGTCANINVGNVTNVNGYFCFLYNNTQAPITITPTGSTTINGSGSPLPFLPGLSCMLQFDGQSNYTTIGLETNTGAVTSLVTVNLFAGNTYYNLSVSQLANEVIVLTNTGAPIANDVTVYFGVANNAWTVHNLTGSTYNIYLQGGTHTTPIGGTYLLPLGTATNYYLNANNATMVSVDVLPPATNASGLIPITSVSPATFGSISWGGVAILKSLFVQTNNIIALTPTPQVLIEGGILADDIVGNILIQGVVYICPSTDLTDLTSITIQRTVNGGAPEDLSWQGAVPIYKVLSGLYRDSDLIPIPISVWDTISSPSTDIIYQIYGSVSTGPTGRFNVSNDASNSAVSYLSVTWFSASFG